MGGWRSTARWQRLAAHVLATHPPVCTAPTCLCPTGRDIDLELDRLRHPWSAQVDHVHEIQHGGDMWDETNLGPIHRHCNIVKGKRTRTQDAQPRLRPSRNW